MAEYVVANTGTYPDVATAFPSNAAVTSGIYYGVAKATPNPTGSFKTVEVSKVRFPGVFDGIATVELGYEAFPCEVSFAIIGTLGECATYIAALNAVLVRSDAARYTVTIPGYPSKPGCKLFGHKFFEDIPLPGGKVMIHVHCVFEQLSDAN